MELSSCYFDGKTCRVGAYTLFHKGFVFEAMMYYLCNTAKQVKISKEVFTCFFHAYERLDIGVFSSSERRILKTWEAQLEETGGVDSFEKFCILFMVQALRDLESINKHKKTVAPSQLFLSSLMGEER